MDEEPLYTNRLIHQKSPYLLQHAHNPVDWYPWGQEAFEAAKLSDKPIFLSIGYATCHWCHVMEEECFEDFHVASLMNETFINVKVDREEHPEIDSLYMEFAQSMMSGSAGWPLNLVLTPDLKPFFAATYLPPVANHGLIGLTDLVARINEIWNGEERENVVDQAGQIVEAFREAVHYKGETLPDKEVVSETADIIFKMADPVYGGMKGAPKFPIGYQSNFMLRYSYTSNDSRAIFLVEKTLDMMQRGGIYDHLGGGFSRYSTDEKWLVPHFEKMLYDNAILIDSYIEIWQLTKKDLYKQVAEETIHYILRDMTHANGAFYSAEDADSEGYEGFFYTWTKDEIDKVLGPEKSALFCEFYNVTKDGNFEDRNILNTPIRLDEYVEKNHLSKDQFDNILKESKELLWKEREKRVHPLKDDKIITAWNGLMIYSLVQAGLAFSNKNYLDAALKAAHFIKNNLWTGQKLLRRWRDNEALYNGGVDDYAYLIRAMIALFEADLGVSWLYFAKQLTNILYNYFKAVPGGALFQTDGTDPNILLRKCLFSDGAEPSGNAVHTENLLKLYQITLDPNYLKQAEDILCAVKKYLDVYPPGYCYHVMNLNKYYDKESPLIVVSLNEDDDGEEIKKRIYQQFIPHKAVIFRKEDDQKLFELIPFLKDKVTLDGKTTLYVCNDGVCLNPANNTKEIFEKISRL